MGGEFSIMERLRLAFEVMSRWETLATLGVFIAFWLIVRYVADPWRAEGHRISFKSRGTSRKAAKAPPVDSSSADEIDDDDILPD